jgi:hypothetical protein
VCWLTRHPHCLITFLVTLLAKPHVFTPLFPKTVIDEVITRLVYERFLIRGIDYPDTFLWLLSVFPG